MTLFTRFYLNPINLDSVECHIDRTNKRKQNKKIHIKKAAFKKQLFYKIFFKIIVLVRDIS